jgi:hypothetical protein
MDKQPYLHKQRAECVSAFIGLYQGKDEHEFAFFRLLSRAEHLSAFVDLCQELSVCLHMSRAGHVYFYVGSYQEHSMFQHVSSRIESWPYIFIM